MELSKSELAISIFTGIFLLLSAIYLLYRGITFIVKRKEARKAYWIAGLALFVLLFVFVVAAAVLYIHSFVNIYNRWDLSVLAPLIVISISGLYVLITESLIWFGKDKWKIN